MTDSPDPSTPDDAPLRVGDDEVERLLREAESLTAKIAEDAGVDAERGNADAAFDPAAQDPSDELDAVHADPLAAAAKVETAAKGLSDLLRDSDENAPDDDEVASLPRPQPRGTNETDGYSTVNGGDRAAFHSAAKRYAGPGSTDGDEEATHGDISVEGELQSAETDKSAHSERIAWTPRCVGGLQAVATGLRKARSSVPAAMKAIILWTDRPFAGLSLGVKGILGTIALATILTGIAAWVLPGALEHNPFADMPTGVAVDAPVLQSSEQ